jgi:hypothetical protein
MLVNVATAVTPGGSVEVGNCTGVAVEVDAFWAWTVNATEVAIRDSSEAEEPQAERSRVMTVNADSQSCFLEYILFSFPNLTVVIIPAWKKNARPSRAFLSCY